MASALPTLARRVRFTKATSAARGASAQILDPDDGAGKLHLRVWRTACACCHHVSGERIDSDSKLKDKQNQMEYMYWLVNEVFCAQTAFLI